MEHLFDEKSNTPSATSNDPELGSLALRKAGNKCNGAPVFTKPWWGTTDMQARPGARRSATSRRFPITVSKRFRLASAASLKRPVSCPIGSSAVKSSAGALGNFFSSIHHALVPWVLPPLATQNSALPAKNDIKSMGSNAACLGNAASKRFMRRRTDNAGFVPKETDGIRAQSTHKSCRSLVSHHRRDGHRASALHHHARRRISLSLRGVGVPDRTLR